MPTTLTQLDDSVTKVAEDLKLSVDKSVMLTHSKLREHGREKESCS